jgi:hypothetical protein
MEEYLAAAAAQMDTQGKRKNVIGELIMKKVKKKEPLVRPAALPGLPRVMVACPGRVIRRWPYCMGHTRDCQLPATLGSRIWCKNVTRAQHCAESETC